MGTTTELPADLIIQGLEWLLAQPGVREYLRAQLVTPQDNATDPNTPLLLTAAETAKLLKIDINRVRGMASAGSLPSIRFGTSIRFPRKGLEEWLQNRGAGNNQAITSSGRRPSDVASAGRSPTTRARRMSKPEQTEFVINQLPPGSLGTKDIAKRLNLSMSTLSQLIAADKLPVIRLGRRVVSTEERLDEYIRLGGKPPAEGWDAYLLKRTFSTAPESQKKEMLDLGFDPATGSFKDSETT